MRIKPTCAVIICWTTWGFITTKKINSPCSISTKLCIRAGERVAVLGRNGSNKSTSAPPRGNAGAAAGSILLDDIALNHLDPADVRRDMQLLSQQAAVLRLRTRQHPDG